MKPMKHEWRKLEKGLYLPKARPGIIDVPELNFFTISGKGNPNDEFFADYIGVLYSLSYAVKMSPKKGFAPDNYFDYTVYPLEGVWDLNEEARKNYDGKIDKNDLVFNLMIRQPEFVSTEYAKQTIERVKISKPHVLLDEVKFEKIEDGQCIQMMHLGSYDSEPTSFKEMEEYAKDQGKIRKCMTHREIYLSDVRKVVPGKLKTVLRFKVK